MLKRIAFRILVLSAAVYLSDLAVDGVHLDGPFAALWAGVMLGLLHVTVRPILLLFSLPFLILTFGLFLWVVNAAVLTLASGLVPGFHVASFSAALLGSLLISIVQWICDRWWWRNVAGTPKITFTVRRGTWGGRPPAGPTRPGAPKRVDGETIELHERPDGHWE